MVLDFLPYKIPKEPRKKIGWIRYVTFALSLLFVSFLFLSHVGEMEKIMFWAFLVGNALYYTVGIVMAFVLKDNRAFCKYVCPVTVFMKPMSYFSLLRVKCDKDKCISCGKCKSVCPMNVDVTDNSRKRKNGTECILCMECVKACPLDRILVETDSPYLPPVPFRGKENGPKYIPYIAREMASLKGMELDDLAEALNENLNRLFHVKHG